MDRVFKRKRTRTVVALGIGAWAVLLAASGLQAAALWNNGAANGSLSPDSRCDDGPNLCGNGGGRSWTVFDNFNVPTGKTWNVSSVDFTDLLTNGTTSDIGQTTASIWNGDPLNGGILIATVTGTAGLANLGGTCGNNNTCLEEFTLSFPAVLTSGTYYFGATVALTATNFGENTDRAFAAGGNTAPGGTANFLQRWELSNGTPGGIGSTWTSGSVNFVFPGALGISETATAFDINGTLAAGTPEPGAMTLVSVGLAGLCFVHRRSRRNLDRRN